MSEPNFNATPNVLTIAGSDSSGGAGIQADLKTFSALKTYGTSVITAVTAQNTKSVSAVHVIPENIIEAQLQSIFEDIDIKAVKIGMLGSSKTIRTVAKTLASIKPDTIVLDPVMVSKGGNRLLEEDAIATLIDTLIPLATLITPNLPEAGCLLGKQEVNDPTEMQATLAELRSIASQSILLKGGHLNGTTCQDLLWHNDMTHAFSNERIDTKNTHGTGCTLSSAITANLARGENMIDSVKHAIDYVHRAIKCNEKTHENQTQLDVGKGHGPLHHFHPWW